jgi:regulator of protease activity HflC (stomatin/prohibitin superfamily)
MGNFSSSIGAARLVTIADPPCFCMDLRGPRVALTRAMRFVLFVLALLTGCAGVEIQPGHRGVVVAGPSVREVLAPGTYHLGGSRIDDFDVTYAQRSTSLRAITSEGLPVTVEVGVMFRPIIAELYGLDTEIGPGYYDTIIEPALRVSVITCLARHSFLDLPKLGTTLGDEAEAELRRRTRGTHIEIAAVSFTNVELPKEITDAMAVRAARDARP